jgi:hypothetical protein
VNGLIQKRLIAAAVATFIFGIAMADDTVPDESAEISVKTTPGKRHPTNEKSDELERELFYRDSSLEHHERAVSEGDFKALANSEPGVDVGRVESVKPVESGAKAEAMDAAEKRVPQTLGHRDRAVNGEKDKDKDKQ